jgi:hypothetical protein
MPQLVIDNLDDKTGWSVNKTANPNGIIEVGEYETSDPGATENLIAGNLEKSLWVRVEGDNGNYAEKTINIDLTGFEEIIFHVKSIYRGNYTYNDTSDFLYKIDLGFSEYYLPAYKEFAPIKINIPEGQTVTKIKITCLHDNRDTLMLSYMVAVKDKIPLDFMNGIKSMVESDLNPNYSLGTVTGNQDDTKIGITGDGYYVERLSQIKIDGANPESHNVRDRSVDGDLYLGDLFDGSKLLYNHTADNLYLVLPVIFGSETKKIISPAIVIWNYDEQQLPKTNAQASDVDTYKVSDGTVEVEKVGFNQIIGFQIDCESNDDEIKEILQTAVRKAIYKKELWVNGRKYNIDIVGPPVRVEATDKNTIPKVSYQIAIEFEESAWPKIKQNFLKPIGKDTITTEILS